ncbi:MAG: lipocalin family protein [Phycisphaerae bacterium]
MTQIKTYRTIACLGLLSASMLVGCAGTTIPLEVVEDVDLNRYAGKWYEIARYPNQFEQNCTGVTADYTIREDGRVGVLNTCRAGSLDAEPQRIEGSARSVSENNAKLKVSFFWPFEGDYWIIRLADDYSYAVVGEPSRNLLWILNREPQMDEALFDEIVASLPDAGYDPDRLEIVEQFEEPLAE